MRPKSLGTLAASKGTGSGDGLGPITDSTYVKVVNVTSLPSRAEPETLPTSSIDTLAKGEGDLINTLKSKEASTPSNGSNGTSTPP